MIPCVLTYPRRLLLLPINRNHRNDSLGVFNKKKGRIALPPIHRGAKFIFEYFDAPLAGLVFWRACRPSFLAGLPAFGMVWKFR